MIDGTSNVYMNWDDGEPNKYHNLKEDVCVMYGSNNNDNAGKWNDELVAGGSPHTPQYVCSYQFACAPGYELGPGPRTCSQTTATLCSVSDDCPRGESCVLRGQRCYRYVNSPS